MGASKSSPVDICSEFILKHLVNNHKYEIINTEDIYDFINMTVDNKILRYKALNLVMLKSDIDEYDTFIRSLISPFANSVCLEPRYQEMLSDIKFNSKNFIDYLTTTSNFEKFNEVYSDKKLKDIQKLKGKYSLPFEYNYPPNAIKNGQYVLFLSHTVANFCKMLSFIVCNKYTSSNLQLDIQMYSKDTSQYKYYCKKVINTQAFDIDLVCAMFLDPNFEITVDYITQNKIEGKLNIGALMIFKLLAWIKNTTTIRYVTLKCKPGLFKYYEQFGFRIGINKYFDYSDKKYLQGNQDYDIDLINQEHIKKLKEYNIPNALLIDTTISDPDGGVGEFYKMYLNLNEVSLNDIIDYGSVERIDGYVTYGGLKKIKYLDLSFAISEDYLKELE
jgi:hypothetical protein